MSGKLVMGTSDVPNDPKLAVAYCEGRAAAKAGVTAPTLGTGKTGVIANNNALAWTSKVYRPVAIRLLNPYKNDSTLKVTVAGDSIDVSLATNSSGAIQGTAGAIITAISGFAPAAALVTVANDGASTGDGTPAAESVTLSPTMPTAAPADPINAGAWGAGYASWTSPATDFRDCCAELRGGGA